MAARLSICLLDFILSEMIRLLIARGLDAAFAGPVTDTSWSDASGLRIINKEPDKTLI